MEALRFSRIRAKPLSEPRAAFPAPRRQAQTGRDSVAGTGGSGNNRAETARALSEDQRQPQFFSHAIAGTGGRQRSVDTAGAARRGRLRVANWLCERGKLAA